MTVTTGDRWRQSWVLVTLVATIAFNALATTLPLMGRTTAEISDAYPVPFTPAGYVFAIWGVIYLGMIVFGVWQARPAQASNPVVRSVAPWVIASGAFNVAWLVAWHAERLALSTVPMVGLAIALVVVRERLRARSDGERNPWGLVWAAQVPFSIYLGWVTVATVANVAVAASAAGWNGAPFSEVAWASAMLVVATAIGLRMLAVRRDVAFASVLVWAYAGIAVRSGWGQPLTLVAAIAIAVLLGGMIGRVMRWKETPA